MEIDIAFHEQIADICLKHFRALPKSGKPKSNEWTVLSSVVLELESCLEVVALGTGSKCIGKSKMSTSGDILNDSHAEIVCRRSFVRYLYSEMKNGDSSLLSYNSNTKKYSINANARFHFCTTHVPCGDAAIFPKQHDEDFGCVIQSPVRTNENEEMRDYEVPAKKVKTEETDIFRTGAKCLPDGEQDLKLQGDGYHVLGAVRTKPGRGDPTLSVSCSDKLSKWCHLGVQGGLPTLLLEKPIYLTSFTITANTPFCKTALERALYNRLGEVTLNLPFSQNRMLIEQSTSQFEFAKDDARSPCPSSISWCKVKDKNLEVAVEGKRQGVTKKNINTAAGRVSICRLQLFKCFIEICELNNLYITECSIKDKSYREFKELAHDYRKSWDILRKIFKVWINKDQKFLNFCSK